MAETLFKNKYLKTETQVLLNCATQVLKLDTRHTDHTYLMTYLYLFLLRSSLYFAFRAPILSKDFFWEVYTS